jgi:hypothetical protein
MLASREGGSSNPFQVPRDAERHAQQSQMIQQKGVSQEPIIVAKLSNGYDLIEGWHRTIQHLKAFPQGYTGPAWVCTGATYKSESVEQGVAEGTEKRCMQCGMKDCKCPGDSCKCKPIAGWEPGKGFKKAVEEAKEKTMSRAAKGNEKYGKDGMKELAKAGREGASEEQLDKIRDKHDKYSEGLSFKDYVNLAEAKKGLE